MMRMHRYMLSYYLWISSPASGYSDVRDSDQIRSVGPGSRVSQQEESRIYTLALEASWTSADAHYPDALWATTLLPCTPGRGSGSLSP
ncbi:hypothetical protein F5888DRAFT_1232352 [Russula emetica]|nr:hypothetical protein F5888DRAFT_1232352 [Russula emetica]